MSNLNPRFFLALAMMFCISWFMYMAGVQTIYCGIPVTAWLLISMVFG
jgi:hypothetical protein